MKVVLIITVATLAIGYINAQQEQDKCWEFEKKLNESIANCAEPQAAALTQERYALQNEDDEGDSNRNIKRGRRGSKQGSLATVLCILRGLSAVDNKGNLKFDEFKKLAQKLIPNEATTIGTECDDCKNAMNGATTLSAKLGALKCIKNMFTQICGDEFTQKFVSSFGAAGKRLKRQLDLSKILSGLNSQVLPEGADQIFGYIQKLLPIISGTGSKTSKAPVAEALVAGKIETIPTADMMI